MYQRSSWARGPQPWSLRQCLMLIINICEWMEWLENKKGSLWPSLGNGSKRSHGLFKVTLLCLTPKLALSIHSCLLLQPSTPLLPTPGPHLVECTMSGQHSQATEEWDFRTEEPEEWAKWTSFTVEESQAQECSEIWWLPRPHSAPHLWSSSDLPESFSALEFTLAHPQKWVWNPQKSPVRKWKNKSTEWEKVYVI